MSTPSKKVPLRKVSAKKTAAKKTAAKAAAKPSTKKTASKKTAAKKVAAKKVASKKVAAKATSKKVASKAQTQVQKPQEAATKPAVKDDLINNTVEEMAALSRPKAMTMMSTLGDAVAADSFRMGGLLSTIKDNQWFIDDGYEDFKSWVTENCQFRQRTCAYFIKSYIELTESGVAWDDVEPLGWSKIKEITGIVTPDNVDEIRSIGLELTVIQLKEWVREYLADDSDLAPTPDDKEWSTMQFKFHRDQRETVEDAMEKAMKVLETDNKSVGIESICLEYLSGGKPRKPNAGMLRSVVAKAGWQRAAESIEENWPELTVKIEKPEGFDDSQEAVDAESEEEEGFTEDDVVDGEIQEDFVDYEEEEPEDPEEEELEVDDSEEAEAEEEEIDPEDNEVDEGEGDEEYEDEYDEDGNLIEYEEVEVDEDGNEIEYVD